MEKQSTRSKYLLLILILIFFIFAVYSAYNFGKNAEINTQIKAKNIVIDSLKVELKAINVNKDSIIQSLKSKAVTAKSNAQTITNNIKPRKYENYFVADTSYIAKYNFIANHKPR